ncbi:MAG: gephyrin-like molybdotransferase Glp [bacterium]
MDVFFNVLPVPAALERLKSYWSPAVLPVEEVALGTALGRVLAQAVVSAEDVPPFNRSTVDGFAVQAVDTFGASDGLPAFLEIVEDIRMGQTPREKLGSGDASHIATGGMLPPGADAVVMVEYTELIDEQTVAIMRPVAPGENVIRRGEDVQLGSQLLPAGRRLRPADIGALAAIGQTRVVVRQKPKVGIISTGDEIVAPETVPGPGQVRDINSYSLAAAVEEAGGEPLMMGLAKDELLTVRAVVEEALDQADIVVLSGGSSVGARDVVAKVLAELGPPGVLVHGVALRPGKPLLIALDQGKPVFGLPGHPASALVTFDLFVRQAMEWLLGLTSGPKPSVSARLTRNLASTAGREDHVRVRLVVQEEGLAAEPVLGKSGLITTLAQADGTITIASEQEGILAGEEVEVYLL